jgi:hypothetical protein
VQSRERFLSIAAIKEACEAIMRPIWERTVHDRRVAEQLAERRRHAARITQGQS